MGAWSSFREGISSGAAKARAGRAADMAALGEKVGNAAHNTGEAIGGIRPFKGAANVTKTGLKAGAITAGVVAGVAALGIMVSRSRSKAKKAAQEEMRNAELNAPLPGMPDEAMGPAQGYQQGQWQNYVAQSRGQMPQIGVGTANPKMNVVPEESVQNLGPAAPTR